MLYKMILSFFYVIQNQLKKNLRLIDRHFSVTGTGYSLRRACLAVTSQLLVGFRCGHCIQIKYQVAKSRSSCVCCCCCWPTFCNFQSAHKNGKCQMCARATDRQRARMGESEREGKKADRLWEGTSCKQIRRQQTALRTLSRRQAINFLSKKLPRPTMLPTSSALKEIVHCTA